MDKLCNDDEFDAFSDSFEGVDWDAIPGLNGQDLNHKSVTKPEETESPSTTATSFHSTREYMSPVTPPPRPTSAQSSEYEFVEVDEEFLTQLSKIEETYAATQAVGPSTSSATSSRPLKRKRTLEGSTSSSKKPTTDRRMKKKKTPEVDQVRQMLNRFEDELICPICSDLFAAAHLANPCGHSCCGSCLWSWISKNKSTQSCPVCRSILDSSVPMIPNFSVDSSVARHVDELTLQRIDGWEVGGSNLLAWEKRKETWKSESAIRAASRAKSKVNPLINNSYLVNGRLVPDGYSSYEDELDEDYEEAYDVYEYDIY